jgi:transaldolase/glucose-6-phosphate isomerase
MDYAPLVSMTGFDDLEPAVRRTLSELDAGNIIGRIWRRDPTVWKSRDEEISNRLGWLDGPDRAASEDFERFAREVAAEGFSRALLLGMGGSSLGAEVLRDVFGTVPGRLRLSILDSTDPDAVRTAAEAAPLEKTLVLVSSKSGTTLETTLFLNYFYTIACDRIGRSRAGTHFVAITDPGTPLELEARRLGFRRVFRGEPNVGGRFSVFSPFGLVPAALLGVDTGTLAEHGRRAARLCRNPDAASNPGAVLGTVLAVAAHSGRDKLRFILKPAIASLGAWLEQLIAESTGKEGRGLLPLVRELPVSWDDVLADAIIVLVGFVGDALGPGSPRFKTDIPRLALTVDDRFDLGFQFFLWEMATAVAGHILRINPFDQPDVAASKKRTEAVLASRGGPGGRRAERKTDLLELRDFLTSARPGDYIALQAFIAPNEANASALRDVAAKFQVIAKRPATFDFGPRFLHSTGQLHKGGRDNGLFVQVTADRERDLPIPSEPGSASARLTFGEVEDAQADGDREALESLGRRVRRIHLALVPDDLSRLAQEI